MYTMEGALSEDDLCGDTMPAIDWETLEKHLGPGAPHVSIEKKWKEKIFVEKMLEILFRNIFFRKHFF